MEFEWEVGRSFRRQNNLLYVSWSLMHCVARGIDNNVRMPACEILSYIYILYFRTRQEGRPHDDYRESKSVLFDRFSLFIGSIYRLAIDSNSFKGPFPSNGPLLLSVWL